MLPLCDRCVPQPASLEGDHPWDQTAADTGADEAWRGGHQVHLHAPNQEVWSSLWKPRVYQTSLDSGKPRINDYEDDLGRLRNDPPW